MARQALHKAANYGNVRTNQSASDDVTKHNQRDKADRRALKQHSRHVSEDRINPQKAPPGDLGRLAVGMTFTFGPWCILVQLSIVAYLIDDAHVDKDAVDKVTRKTALYVVKIAPHLSPRLVLGS